MSRPSAIKSVFWLTFSEILFNLSGYIIHAVAGRALGPADYGRYGLVITLTTVIVVLIGNGIPTAMSKYLSEVFEKDPAMVPAIRKQGIRLQVLTMGAVTAAFFLAAPLIAEALNDATLTPLFRLSSLIIPAFAAASFYFSYFTGLHLFNHQSVLKSFRSVARVVVIVGLILAFGLNGAIAGYILAPLLTFLLGIHLDRKVFAKEYAHLPQDRVFPSQKLLAYAWPVTLFMLFYEIFVSADLYLIKAILQNDIATGLYNAALTIGRIPYYLFYALAIFLLPALAKIKSQNDPEEMSRVMTQSLRYAGIILLPTAILIAAYAAPLTTLFFGAKYAAAAPILRILVFGLSFLTIFYLLCSALNGIGQAALSMKLSVIGTVFSILLNIVFIHRYGIIGAAWATSISAIIATLIALILSQRHIRIRFESKNIAKTMLAGIIVWYGSTLLPAHDWLFIIFGTALSLAYVAILILFRVLTKADLDRFKTKKSPA